MTIKRGKYFINKFLHSLKKNGVKNTFKKTYIFLQNRNKNNVHNCPETVIDAYSRWISYFDTVRNSDVEEMKQMADDFIYKSLISIVTPVYNTPHDLLCAMIDSVLKQTYSNWELCLADDASTDLDVREILRAYEEKDSRIKVVYCKENGNISAASNAALSIANGEYVALVDHDDFIPEQSLWCVVYYINKAKNEVDLLYSDEDKLDENSRRNNPYFKGGWNQQLVFQQNFVAHLGVYRRSIINQIQGFRVGFEGSQDYDLLLRFLKHTNNERIVHIPYILYHWRKFSGNGSFSTKFQEKSDCVAKQALLDFFEGKAAVSPVQNAIGWWKIDRKNQRKPFISIVIPFKDKVELLKQCITGLLHFTEYQNFEIILVDNASIEDKTSAYLDSVVDGRKIRLIKDTNDFNYSHLNNEAVKLAKGELILLLNSDIAIYKNDWLSQMVDVACQENVGVVGAKLLYSNHTVQHVGVTTGIYEVAAHHLRHVSENDVGYFGWSVLERDCSAVTGACLLIWKHIYEQVRGLDEENLAVSFNDVDLCLKVKALGYRIVFTPYAVLFHLESQSRGEDLTIAQKKQNYDERRFMHLKYGCSLQFDPFYNPVLSLSNEDVNLADFQRQGKPWRDWMEFVCPFHRGDVLVGLQVACTAAAQGKKIRMHVSKDIYSWLEPFPYKQYIRLEPIDIGIPKAEETSVFMQQALHKVALREDSSCHIVCSHPKRALCSMGVDLVENMLENFGLPITTELLNVMPDATGVDIAPILPKGVSVDNYILLHPNGGWQLKSLSPEIVKQISNVVHKKGCRLVQIGGDADRKMEFVDGYILKNLNMREWTALFTNAKAVIGVDSWTAHFGSIVNANQVIIYGSTASRDVESKRHFKNHKAAYLKFESLCDSVPCNAYECREGGTLCKKMFMDVERLSEFLGTII